MKRQIMVQPKKKISSENIICSKSFINKKERKKREGQLSKKEKKKVGLVDVDGIVSLYGYGYQQGERVRRHIKWNSHKSRSANMICSQIFIKPMEKHKS